MFELTRTDPTDRHSLRSLMSVIANDPFFTGASPRFAAEGNLPLDISERDGDIVVRASLPGFDKSDIDVQLHNGVLTIKAEHTEENETRDEKYYCRERRYGAVSRRVALPGMTGDASVQAELKDGVLTLMIPQAEAVKPKKIAIK